MAKQTKAEKKSPLALFEHGNARCKIWRNEPDKEHPNRSLLSIEISKGIKAQDGSYTNPAVYLYSGEQAVEIGTALVKAGEYLRRHQKRAGNADVQSIDALLEEPAAS